MELTFDYYINFDSTKFSKDDKLVLKKGLSFAPSVIVNKSPDKGFLFFKNLLSNNNKDINKIISDNLNKKRLNSVYPNEVTNIFKIIKK